MATEGFEVKVYIYDISRGLAKAMSQALLGKRLEGIWHTGIVVYGQEYYFGGTGGIECCPPCGTMLGQPDVKHTVGYTQIPKEIFIDYLKELAVTSFRPSNYHLLDHNCNTFSSEVAKFLTGNDIPTYITSLPADVMSTPFGQMIRPFVDAMSVQPTGGHALFQEPASSQSAKAKAKPSQKPQSTSQQSASSGHNKTPNKTPFIFKQRVASEAVWMEDSSSLSSRDKCIMKEIYEYLSEKEPSWSLGRNHLNLLYKLVLEDDHWGVDALFILQKLAVLKDVIELIQNDPNCLLKDVLEKFEIMLETKKAEITNLLCNYCSEESGHRLLMDEKRDPCFCSLTCSICVSCILSGSKKLFASGVALCYNISLYKVSEDIQLELGTALLNGLDKEMNEQTAIHVLTALLTFMEGNPEVQGLAGVLDIDLQPLRQHSAAITALCDKLHAKIGL